MYVCMCITKICVHMERRDNLLDICFVRIIFLSIQYGQNYNPDRYRAEVYTSTGTGQSGWYGLYRTGSELTGIVRVDPLAVLTWLKRVHKRSCFTKMC